MVFENIKARGLKFPRVIYYPKFDPQLLQCHVFVTLPNANTPNAIADAALDVPEIFLTFDDGPNGHFTP